MYGTLVHPAHRESRPGAAMYREVRIQASAGRAYWPRGDAQGCANPGLRGKRGLTAGDLQGCSKVAQRRPLRAPALTRHSHIRVHQSSCRDVRERPMRRRAITGNGKSKPNITFGYNIDVKGFSHSRPSMHTTPKPFLNARRAPARHQSIERFTFLGFVSPYGAPEHRQALGERPKGRRQDVCASPTARRISRWDARDPKPRSTGSVRHRGALSLGDFSLREQREVTLGAGAEHPRRLNNKGASTAGVNCGKNQPPTISP